MKKSQLSSYVVLFLLTLSFSVSRASVLSSILDITPGSSSEDLLGCLLSNSNNITSTSQLLFTPANSSFLPVWQASVQNTKFLKPSTPKPSVIVTPVEETLVQTTLHCAKKHGYELRIRSGGHDFEGLSYSSDVPFVMLDFTNMRAIDVDVANRTTWVQAGAALGALYYAISQKTDTLYFPAGLCPTVNIGGYIGGGGYGNLLRKYGTAADNVVDVRFIDVNGKILDRKSMGEDLFWAIRGGGASSFGIVLAWKLNTSVTVTVLHQKSNHISTSLGTLEAYHMHNDLAYVLARIITAEVISKQLNTEFNKMKFDDDLAHLQSILALPCRKS
ncbi:hypothetical protein L2E82_02401 [Cichorium intybus]|uniref:Uncharacterized protein n=1 Tax=Cichorium intybus TaxID=13427 RepID=A0ACB9H2P6_CICIN|nr:hypothetical protein L2E82_02401 [Cichorium intybus]